MTRRYADAYRNTNCRPAPSGADSQSRSALIAAHTRGILLSARIFPANTPNFILADGTASLYCISFHDVEYFMATLPTISLCKMLVIVTAGLSLSSASVCARTLYIEPGQAPGEWLLRFLQRQLRDERLNQQIFYSPKGERTVIEQSRNHFNTITSLFGTAIASVGFSLLSSIMRSRLFPSTPPPH